MTFDLSISASFTASPLDEILQLLLSKIGFTPEISHSPYGQVFQSLLEPSSEFNKKKSGWNILLLNLEDLINDQIKNSENEVPNDTIIELLAQSFSSYCQLSHTPLLVIITPCRSQQARKLSFTIKNLGESFDIAKIQLVHWQEFEDLYFVSEVFDIESNRFGHIPYTDDYFAALASIISRIITVRTTPEIKVIVVDCDNTLWKGVCGEDGPLGVSVESGYRSLQQKLIDQCNAGRLICLASKNSESDVYQVFQSNPSMVLEWQHVVNAKINWLPKSTNIIQIAAELNLGLDSFVFIDDNPVEIAEVRSQCPNVLCIQLPQDHTQIEKMLEHIWVLDKHQVTIEDTKRVQSYRDNIQRAKLKEQAISFQDFIAQLNLQIDIEDLTESNTPRSAQLSQRTNQFNLTTRRFEESQLKVLATKDGMRICTVHLEDRFGQYGQVGLFVLQANEDSITVTDLMLSCRALGKGVEHNMLAFIGDWALKMSKQKVIVAFRLSSKNTPAQAFLESLETYSLNAESNQYIFDPAKLSQLNYSDGFEPNAKNKASAKQVSKKTPSDTCKTPNGEATKSATLNPANIVDTGFLCQNPRDIIAKLASEIKPRPPIQEPYYEPKQGLETQIANIWKTVLRIKNVGRSDKFVDLGGNSLLLVKIHLKLLEELNLDVPITSLFKYTTVSALAEHLKCDINDQNPLMQVKDRAQKSRAALMSRQRKNRGSRHG
ncbi:MAG: HAD-IIIC family phosphatase [Pseudomonadales bacterium]|nr:HAD-IIIC family phosphatase [Pseudomonadales bacterium]